MFDQLLPCHGEPWDVRDNSSQAYTRLRGIESLLCRHGWQGSMRQLKPGPLHVCGRLTRTDSATVVDVAVSHRLEVMGRTRRDTIAMVLPICRFSSYLLRLQFNR